LKPYALIKILDQRQGLSVEGKYKAVPLFAIKLYRRKEACLRTFLTSGMDGSAASRSGRFTRGKRTLGTHWELESSRTAPEDLKKKQKSLPL
jgi:hypothetical protein